MIDSLEAVGEHGRPGWVNILDPTLPALAFLGVRYIFDQPQPPRRLRRLERERRGFADIVYRGHDAVVWERPDALPRVFFPHRLLIEPDTNAALRQARQLEDFAAVAVADRPAEASSADSGASEAGALVKPQSEDAAYREPGGNRRGSHGRPRVPPCSGLGAVSSYLGIESARDTRLGAQDRRPPERATPAQDQRRLSRSRDPQRLIGCCAPLRAAVLAPRPHSGPNRAGSAALSLAISLSGSVPSCSFRGASSLAQWKEV